MKENREKATPPRKWRILLEWLGAGILILLVAPVFLVIWGLFTISTPFFQQVLTIILFSFVALSVMWFFAYSYFLRQAPDS